MKCRICFCLFFLCGACCRGDVEEHLRFLHKDVEKIGIAGVPGPICVFGEDAFAVITGGSKGEQVPVVAAGEWFKGRIVAFGHGGYLSGDTLRQEDTLHFFTNCIDWICRQESEPLIGVYKNEKLTGFLHDNGLNAQNTDLRDLRSLDLVVINAHQIPYGQITAIQQYVKTGGGLITGGLGWGWKQLHPARDLATDFAGNRLLAPAGLIWADGTAKTTCEQGYLVQPVTAETLNASRALERMLQYRDNPKALKNDSRQISTTLTMVLRSLPASGHPLMSTIRRLEKELSAEDYPSSVRPVPTGDILRRVLLTKQTQDTQTKNPKQLSAHPAASAFPGSVPADAVRIEKTIKIDTSIPRWHSTGLYAAPGEPIRVSCDPSGIDKALKIRIGAHKDRIWHHDNWKRFPEITRTFALEQTEMIAANAFGGLIYVEVPHTVSGITSLTIQGAVRDPYYIHGKTKLDEWKNTIRKYPAPWAELAGKRIIITVPSENIRTLEDPAALMNVWDSILDACADLAGIDRNRPSPERIVPDVQISAGYMHSGYPIMTHADQYARLVDWDHLRKGSWGLFHELGHNHQSRDWTFSGTGEVTVNLFTTYVFDRICGVPPEQGRVNLEKRKQYWEKYVQGGRRFEHWKKDPFLALTMYLQMQQQFGWEPFVEVFAEYRELPDSTRPKNDDQKRDQWMIRFSKAVGHNLGPFFEAWNVPVSEDAQNQIARLPIWLPEEIASLQGQ